MKYRQAAAIFFALMTLSSVSADARPGSEKSPKAAGDLTGYWQQEDGAIVHFTQEGSSLISRYDKRSADNEANDIDFTATVHGNLVYGAHRGPFSRAMQEKCATQIWVGMGLTLSDDGNMLEGFRGDRIIDPENCSARNSAPTGLVYKRVSALDPAE